MVNKVEKIMVAGDWHGNTVWADNTVKIAHKYGARKIVQCGDFGIWTHDEDGHTYLDTLNHTARTLGVKIYFVGGNHENWDHLDWWEKNNPRTYQGHVIVRSHIFYIVSGTRWMWNDKWFMGVGGAVSIDREYRLKRERSYKTGPRPRTLWWPQEQLSDEVLYKIENGPRRKTDYLFTHDCPTNAPFQFRLKNDPESQMHRQKMDRLGRAVKPDKWFHGHMHDKYDAYRFPMYESHSLVYGMRCDGCPDNWGILNTSDNTFTWNTDYVRMFKTGIMLPSELVNGD